MKNRVLLLDGHTVQSISVARSLYEAGFDVCAFIEARCSFGYVSRFIHKKILCPPLLKSPERYMQFLVSYLEKNSIDLIIPMYNDSAEWLSRNKEAIEDRFNVRCAIPSFDVFVKAHDKEQLMEVCRDHDIPHPRTMHLSEENINEAVAYVGFPALIKPNVSSGARGIVKVECEQALRQKYRSIIQEFGASTLQEFIDHSGIYYNVMLYRDRDGKCHESVVIKIMRYFPLKGGTSCYCETIKHEGLERMCRRVLDVLNWQGFADFDVMESKAGELKIIEINPRVPASIHAAYISGINYPELMFCDYAGKEMPAYHNQTGKAMRFGGLDVMWFLFSPERFSFRPSWFKFCGKNVYYQDGSFADPLPMLMGCVSGVLKYLNPSFRKSKIKS